MKVEVQVKLQLTVQVKDKVNDHLMVRCGAMILLLLRLRFR